MAQQLKYTFDLNLKAYPNELTQDVDNDYTVKVNTQSTPLTLDDLAASVAARLGEEVSKVRSIIEVFMDEVASAVASGYCVSTDAFYAQPMASGVVMEHELSQPVDRERVRVYASFRQGPLVKEYLGKAKLQLFLQPAVTGPYIAGMTSAFVEETAAADGVTTRVPLPMEAGEMCVITGDNLKVVGSDPSVGITLIKADAPQTTFFIPPKKISPNTPKKLQFNLPVGVTEGAWLVKVTTQYAGSKYEVKEPRSFTLSTPVYVGTAPDGGGGDDGGEEEGGGSMG